MAVPSSYHHGRGTGQVHSPFIQRTSGNQSGHHQIPLFCNPLLSFFDSIRKIRNDPIRKQAIPCFEEITMADMGEEDPLEEKRDSVVPGLVHRYPDRVLMVLTDICPMFCRHCTRKREWQHGGWVRQRRRNRAHAGLYPQQPQGQGCHHFRW